MRSILRLAILALVLVDCEGRWIPESSPFSFRGYARRGLHDRIDADLRAPGDHVIFPDPARIEDYSAAIAAAGGVDIAYGGFGYRRAPGIYMPFGRSIYRRW